LRSFKILDTFSLTLFILQNNDKYKTGFWQKLLKRLVWLALGELCPKVGDGVNGVIRRLFEVA
jgi:hypothetical protein